MNRDIDLMKEFNFNAVRTCHYPDDPTWYELTDRRGLMVICEANVEAHGVPDYYKPGSTAHLPKNPRFHDSIVERNTRMIQFYRSHPSIVIWSLGNESGDGPAMADAYQAIKAIDSTRPVQYEAAQDSDHSDIKCPMYLRPWFCEKYVANHPAKPLILCEYTHAMGNSNGDVADYFALAARYPSFQGGFVWDFQDQALWKSTPGLGTTLAYGGDFGDRPNDDNFNCNGLFDACRNPHPGAYELKYVQRPIKVTRFDWTTGVAELRSEYLFASLEGVEASVTYLKDGQPVREERLEVEQVGPEQSLEVKLQVRDADSVLFRFVKEEDGLIAWDQFSRPFEPRTIAPGEPTELALKYNFWRAPTDNDRGWKMPEVCKVWREATAAQTLPAGVKSDLKVTAQADGSKLVDWTLVVPKGLPPIPRVGLMLTLPRTEDTVSWYGLGPWENYSDRARGAILAVHQATVGLTRGIADEKIGRIRYPANRLNPDNYSEPGEQGYRTGVRRLQLGAVEIEAVNAPFGFNLWPYPQTMLEGKKHQWELTETNELTLNVDAVQMGVGGDNSWGDRPHPAAIPGEGTYRLVFKVKGL